MNSFYDEMSWLLPIEEVSPSGQLSKPIDVDFVRRLAGHRVPERQVRKIAKALGDAPDALGLQPLRIAVLTDANLTFLKEHLIIAAAARRFALKVHLVEYSRIAEQLVDPGSELYKFEPDFVLHACFGAMLRDAVATFDAGYAAGLVTDVVGVLERELSMAIDNVKAHSKAQLVVQTIPHVFPDLFGNSDRGHGGAFGREVAEFNARLSTMGLPIVDIAKVADRIGLYRWIDDGKYHWAKQPFNMAWAPHYCDAVIRKIGNMRGKEKKVLVLDLDNTLWGGVIGDDGVDGIHLGNNSVRGEAFLAGQRYYKSLANRGVVLAVCSKNDEANARAPFEKHPDMILRFEDIAVFVANWQDKPANLRHIAGVLGLGLDSFVFLDDNPAERAFVRRELPEVAVPEVPDHTPSLYPRIIEAAGYFESAGFTAADQTRLADYKANAQRAGIKAKSSDLHGYLGALEMKLDFGCFQEVDKDRILQLINRSNQFNLTTRRYTQTQLDMVFGAGDLHGFSARLKDKFSDSGLISLLIVQTLEQPEATWFIDTWVMSCRVLGRMVEEALVDCLVHEAARKGIRRLVGRYLPTEKNGMVADLYRRMGFYRSDTPIGSGALPEGGSDWVLDVDAHLAAATSRPPLPFDRCQTSI